MALGRRRTAARWGRPGGRPGPAGAGRPDDAGGRGRRAAGHGRRGRLGARDRRGRRRAQRRRGAGEAVGPRPAAAASGGRLDASAAALPDDLLASFLPRELVSRVRAGQTGWLAEFRRLTVVFVGIRDLDADAPGALALAQDAFRSAQAVIDRYEGTLNQIVDDDKGLTVVASWGFPDRTHEDDPSRGVLAARAIVDALAGLGLTAAAGVTTGRAFTGIRGSAERSEYAMLGDVVNLAARIMQSSRDEVRTDAPTQRAAAGRLAAAGLASTSVGALHLKGKAADIEAFRVEHATERRRPPPAMPARDRPPRLAAGAGSSAARRSGRR